MPMALSTRTPPMPRMISCCSARVAVAAVQPRRQLAIPRRVLFEIGVEQVELDAADADAPDGDEHRAVAERHRGDAGLPSGVMRRLDRRFLPVQLLVDLLLPAVGREALVKIALRIHEADADERHAKVAGFLAVIAGEHAEAAGVDRQRLVQRELGGEVGDRLAVQVRALALAPRVVRGARGVEPGDRCDRSWPATRDRRWRGQRVRRDQLQHPHRVVRGLPPQRIVETAEDAPRVGVPAPPEVVGEFVEAMDAIGQFAHGKHLSLDSRNSDRSNRRPLTT